MDDSLRSRRDDLMRKMHAYFGVHPTRGGGGRPTILLPAGEHARYVSDVFTERNSTPISRGYFLGLGGEVQIIGVPEWTLDPARIARLRFIAATRRRLRRLVSLTR
jgi:hypothetical protein